MLLWSKRGGHAKITRFKFLVARSLFLRNSYAIALHFRA